MPEQDPELQWAMARGSSISVCGCNEGRNVTCFKHKLRTIQFGKVKKSPQTLMEKRWERDMPAYQRLRRNGLQPKSIDGSAALEQRAKSQTEVEMGHIFDRKVLPKVEEGMALAKDLDWTPKDSVEAVKDKYHRKAV